MRDFIIAVLFVTSTCFSFSQNGTIAENKELRKEAAELARAQIHELKEGCLWVRLTTRSREIDYYRKNGNEEAAKKIQSETERFNRQIMLAFRSNFNFCPVYFFADTFSMEIVNGNYEKVVFYDEEMRLDPGIQFTQSDFFICEYGQTMNESDDGSYGGNNMGVSAFVIMDSAFKQLSDPFPYYEKGSFGKNDQNRLNGKVLKLSEKLTKYLAEG